MRADPNLVPRAFFENAAKGKGPGIGWSFMYSDWSMTRTLLCNLGLIYSNFGINFNIFVRGVPLSQLKVETRL
jgi:hypothetical protein